MVPNCSFLSIIVLFTLVISLLTIDAVPVLLVNENENLRQREVALQGEQIEGVAVIVPPQPIRRSREAKPIFGLFGEPIRSHHHRPHHFGNGYGGDGYNGYGGYGGGGCGYKCGGGGNGGSGSFAGASAFSGSNSYGGYPGGSNANANAQSSSINFNTPFGNFGASSSYASSQSNSFRK